MNTYIENQNDILHETKVDFVLRPCAKEIHIVQYDKSLPVVKVELYRNGSRYSLSETAIVNVRLTKLDNTFVYETILGANAERNIIYFTISEQMATKPGRIWPVLEVIEPGPKVACSSPICLIIDKNPIQEGQIESHDEFPIIYELQATVADHEFRIAALEQGGGGGGISDVLVDGASVVSAGIARIDLSNKADKADCVTIHTNQYNIDGEKTFNSNVWVSAPGSLALYFTPTTTNHAVNKGYVDNAVQAAIEGLEIRSDVVDIVGTYADLQNYDTTKLGPNDLVKVITDSTHSNAISYYRWVEQNDQYSWVYVASEGPFYTISQVNTLLADYPTLAGNNIFTGNNTFNNGIKVASFDNSSLFGDANGIMPFGNGVANLGRANRNWKDIFLTGIAYMNTVAADQYLTIKIQGTDYYYISDATLSPNVNNAIDLGHRSRKWKNFFLTGAVNLNASNYGLVFPDTTSFTANKTIATTDPTPLTYYEVATTDNVSDFITNNTSIRDKIINIHITSADVWLFGMFTSGQRPEYKLTKWLTGDEYDGLISSVVTFADIINENPSYSYEKTSNKVTSLSASSTHTQYASAKCVYDTLALKANISDLSNYVDLTTDDQNIQGYKKFINGLLVENIYMASPSNPKRQVLKFGYATEVTTFYQTLAPDVNCRFEHAAGQIFEYGRDIGTQSFKFKHLFLGGYINKNASGFGLVFPDTTSYTANKTIATLDDIPSNPQVIQDLTTNTAVTLDSTALASLKSTHYAVVSSPVMTGLDSAYEFVNVKFSIDSTNYIVKLSKNDTNKYSGMFFIEGTGSLYEVTVYYNGSKMIFRCATVYENVQ